MIPIFRYSTDGFESKVQDYHMRILLSYFNPPDYTGLNDYQIRMFKCQEEENRPLLAKLDLNDWSEGVFVFVGQLPLPHIVLHELNHLKQKQLSERKVYVGEICPTADVYSVYGLVPVKYTIKEYLKRYHLGAVAFVTKRSLSLIQNSRLVIIQTGVCCN